MLIVVSDACMPPHLDSDANGVYFFSRGSYAKCIFKFQIIKKLACVYVVLSGFAVALAF